MPASLLLHHHKTTVFEWTFKQSFNVTPPGFQDREVKKRNVHHRTGFSVALHELTCTKSDKPWKKPGTPGNVTVIEGAGPEPPGPADPSREPRSWARLPSGLPSPGWPTEAVLVVRVEVCPDVLAEEEGGETVEESDEDEVEKEDWELVEEMVDMASPGAVRDNGKKISIALNMSLKT